MTACGVMGAAGVASLFGVPASRAATSLPSTGLGDGEIRLSRFSLEAGSESEAISFAASREWETGGGTFAAWFASLSRWELRTLLGEIPCVSATTRFLATGVSKKVSRAFAVARSFSKWSLILPKSLR